MPMFPGRNPFENFDRTVRRMFERSPNFSVRRETGMPSAMDTYVDQSVDREDGILSVVMDLPGVGKEDIDATVKQHNRRQWLIVEAQSDQESLNRVFRQQVALREEVDAELADTEYNNGVLTIEFPVVKSDDDQGTTIEI